MTYQKEQWKTEVLAQVALRVFTAGTYSPVTVGWVSRVSGNPWISRFRSVLDCKSYDELKEMFGWSGSSEFKVRDVPSPLDEALGFFQSMQTIDRVVKSLTTSQTFNSGVTVPVKPDSFLGFEQAVTPMPIAAFLEPWVKKKFAREPEVYARLLGYIESVRRLDTTNRFRYDKLGKLNASATNGYSAARPGGMGGYPYFFFCIGDTPLSVPASELKTLEQAAATLYAGFSQFADQWRRSGSFDETRKSFRFNPSARVTNLETYVLAVDFMKDQDGRWTITDVGGLGGGAIVDVDFCNRVSPLYADPSKTIGDALSTYREGQLNLVRPAFGMNIWEGEQLSSVFERNGTPYVIGENAGEGRNLLLSVKPKPEEVINPLPTPEFAALYNVPKRTYALQAMREVLAERYNVGIPAITELSTVIENQGSKEAAIDWLGENYGSWVVYRGSKFRTGPIMLDAVAGTVEDPKGVVLEKLCPPWLEMKKGTMRGEELIGTYAAELRLYVAVKRNG